jgi:16S rRNA G966 N2-methylase RsmD
MQQKNERFDLIFMDPPYDNKIKDMVLNLLNNSQIIDSDSIVILEHSPKEIIQNEYGSLVLKDRRKYGDNTLTFFKRR